MRLLSKIVLVNWHLFQTEDIDLVGDTALLGENRSGKSTILDAMQVILSGCNGNLYRLNRSAGDRGKKVERSVRDYCLGSFEGYNKREAVRSYIGLVFKDETDREAPVSIGLSIDASTSDVKEHVRGMFILEGHAISHTDFISTNPEGKTIVTEWDDTREKFRSIANDRNSIFHNSHTSKEFIREYMRILMTAGHAADHERYIKTLVNGLAFEGMTDVSSFMRKFILEDRKIEIGQLRASIRTYRDIKNDIDNLTEELGSMEGLQGAVANYDNVLAEYELQKFLSARSHLIGAFLHNREAKKRVRNIEKSLEANTDTIEGFEYQVSQFDDSKTVLESRLNNSGIISAQNVLNTERRSLEKAKVSAFAALERAHRELSTLIREVKHTEGEFEGFPAFLEAIGQIAGNTVGVEPKSWPQNPGMMDKLLQGLQGAGSAPYSHIQSIFADMSGDKRNLLNAKDDIQRRMDTLRGGAVSLSKGTDALVRELSNHGIRYRILCEMVEVVDESWRNAAEALLGRDREAIFVDPKDTDEAIRIFRRDRRSFSTARLANTRKMQSLPSDRTTARPGSLATTLKTDDDTVRAYIAFRIGNVRLAETQEDLHNPGRAIMKDGTYDDGIAIDNKSSMDSILGKGSQAIELERLRAKFNAHVEKLNEMSRDIEQLQSVQRLLAGLEEQIKGFGCLKDLVAEYDEAQERVEEIDKEIAGLKIQQDPELLAELDQLKVQIKTLGDELSDVREERGSLKEALKGARETLSAGSNVPGSKMFLTSAWKSYDHYKGAVPSQNRRHALREAVYLKAPRGTKLSPVWFLKRGEVAEKNMRDREVEKNDLKTKIERSTMEHFRSFARTNPFDPDSLEFVNNLRRWLFENVSRIKSVDLPQYQQQAADAAMAADRMFKNSFLAELRKRFGDLEDEKKRLNDALANRPLHNEIYSFSRSENPRFKSIIALVKAAHEDDTILLPLFGAAAQRADEGSDNPHSEAMMSVESILLDDEFDFTDYEDYRNYYDFEMVMRDIGNDRETTYSRRRATGSGAEQQVPFYVAIGAALSRVYHGIGSSERDDMGIGLALFDEAFSKLDGKNQRQILNFYKDIGLQTLAAAPSERKAILLETVGTIAEVFRYGDVADCSVLYTTDVLRDGLKDINPDNSDEETLRGRFDAGVTESEPAE